MLSYMFYFSSLQTLENHPIIHLDMCMTTISLYCTSQLLNNHWLETAIIYIDPWYYMMTCVDFIHLKHCIYKHIIINIVNHRDIPTRKPKNLPTGASQDWRWSFRSCIARRSAFLPSWFSDMGQGPGARVMVGRRGSLGVANSWWNSSELSSWNSSDAFVCSFRDVSKFGYGSVWLSRMDGQSPKNIVFGVDVNTSSPAQQFFPQGEPFPMGKPWVFCFFDPSHQPLHAHRHLLVGGWNIWIMFP